MDLIVLDWVVLLTRFLIINQLQYSLYHFFQIIIELLTILVLPRLKVSIRIVSVT